MNQASDLHLFDYSRYDLYQLEFELFAIRKTMTERGYPLWDDYMKFGRI